MVFNTRSSMLVLVICVGYAAAVDIVGKRHEEKTDEVAEAGENRLYFTGPGYTINLIPQAILLGLLSFLAVYFLGLDLFGTTTGTSASGYGAPDAGYGAPEPTYGAPSPSYGAPETGYDAPSYNAARYYDTYGDANADTLANTYDAEGRRKRSAF